MKTLEKKDYKFWLFVLLLIVALVSRILYAFVMDILWWDESIYIGMAKFIYSGGVLGFWEMFRPPLMSIIVGFGWFIGLDIKSWGVFVELVMGMALLVLVYFIGEKIKKDVGLIALGIMALLPSLFLHGNKILSGIPSTAIALLAIWLVFKRKWFFAGLFSALAFLTRFPQGVIFLAIIISIILIWLTSRDCLEKWKSVLKDLIYAFIGFMVFTLPYMIINTIQYEHPLQPLINASIVINETGVWVYDYGNLFYITGLLIQNVFFVFAIVALFVYFYKRKWHEHEWNMIVIPTLILICYLFWLPHKEFRYFIPIYPYLAILAGLGIFWLISFLKTKDIRIKNIKKRVIIGVIVISLILNIIVMIFVSPPYSQELDENRKEFIMFFKDSTPEEKMLIATSVLYTTYTNKPLVFLGGWEYCYDVYGRFEYKSSHIAVDICDYPCQENSFCSENRETFIEKMNRENRLLFNSSYERYDGVICPLLIWER